MAERVVNAVSEMLKKFQASHAERRAFEAVMNSPQAHELAARIDRERADKAKQAVAKRRKLLDQATAARADKGHARRCEELAAKVEKLRQDLKAAEVALAAAAHDGAVRVMGIEREAHAIEVELRDQLDARLAEYRVFSGAIEASVFDARDVQPAASLGPDFRTLSGFVVVNAEKVDRAMSVYRRTYDASRSLELAALTFDEVTALLVEWCTEVRSALEALGVRAGPSVDPKTAEVIFGQYMANGEVSGPQPLYKSPPSKM